MARYGTSLAVGVACFCLLIGSCKKDESGPTATPTQTGPALTAAPPGVTVGTGGSQNVTITGGTHPYTAQSQNLNLASVQFTTNADTATIMITGVSTATGSTSVVVRDASTPTRAVAVGVTKTQ
jgi:hypothetical protein